MRRVGLGLVPVVGWSVVNLFGALLYNAIADVIGGIEVSLEDAEAPAPPSR